MIVFQASTEKNLAEKMGLSSKISLRENHFKILIKIYKNQKNQAMSKQCPSNVLAQQKDARQTNRYRDQRASCVLAGSLGSSHWDEPLWM